jgi:LemA protein
MPPKIGLWVALGIGVILIFTLIGSYNGLVSSSQGIDAQWAQVQNDMQRRYDLIPNLVNTVKGYAKHESSVLEEVTRLRSQWGNAKTPTEQANASDNLGSALGRLMVVVEKYPELKANENFLKLQDELAGTENRIAVERKRFNEAVLDYNVRVQSFPGNIMANMFGFKVKDAYFKANAAAQEAPKVQF